MQVLTGARIFDGRRMLDDHALVVDGARIVVVTPYANRPHGVAERDLGGRLLSPGFIDVPVNGGGGALFNADPSVTAVARIAKAHRRYGVTGMMLTVVCQNYAAFRARFDRNRAPSAGLVPIEPGQRLLQGRNDAASCTEARPHSVSASCQTSPR